MPYGMGEGADRQAWRPDEVITAQDLETIVERCLSEGVPPGVVSRVFDLDIELVKSALKGVRVKKYGTNDINDYLEQMKWAAIEDGLTTLATGSVAERAQVRSAVLGRQMAAAAKRSPEGERDQRQQVEDMFANMRGD